MSAARETIGPNINREFKFRMEPRPHLYHPVCRSFVSEVETGDDLMVIVMMAHDHRCPEAKEGPK